MKLMHLGVIAVFITVCVWTAQQFSNAGKLVAINAAMSRRTITPDLAEQYSQVALSGVSSAFGLLLVLLLGAAAIRSLGHLLNIK